MASGIACRPAWSLIDLHGVNILPKDQGQDSWWEQGRCEERSNDPLLLVVLKFMRQLCRNILLGRKHPRKLTLYRANTAETFLF